MLQWAGQQQTVSAQKRCALVESEPNPNVKSAVSRSAVVFRQETAKNGCESPGFQPVCLPRCQEKGIGVSGCAIGITSFIMILR